MTDVPTIIDLIQEATDGLFRNARRMDADQLRYAPTEKARTAADMLWEVAEAADWFAHAIESGDSSRLTWEVWGPKLQEKAPPEMDIDRLEDKARAAVERFVKALAAVPPESLDTPIPGSEWSPTPRAISIFPLRNIWYHYGQINYIQTCYGDFEM